MKKYFKTTTLKMPLKVEKFIVESKNELDKFFGFSINDPLIFFLEKRADMDVVAGKKTEGWLSAMARSGVIFIFHPNIFDKETTHKKEEFWKTLKHEIVHLYFNKETNGTKPVWMNEGLACYLAGQKNIKRDVINTALNVFDYNNVGGMGVYSLGQFWVELLLTKFGKEKFVLLLKLLFNVVNEKQFMVVFKKVYGFNANKKDFAKLLK